MTFKEGSVSFEDNYRKILDSVRFIPAEGEMRTQLADQIFKEPSWNDRIEYAKRGSAFFLLQSPNI